MAVVGRADEIEAVLACVGEAAAGRASTLLVRGEPGVGKTSLVGEACEAAGDADTIWTACLPLTSMTTPLLPLRPALRRAGLGDDVTLVEFDGWLEWATADRPVVLVVDDLHWADRSSLDVLLYAIAGRADRGLAVIATVRAGADGEWLSGWLADVRRLPRVRELALDRLDRVGTGEQIAAILGRPADEGLVDEVFSRTGGNPYLSALLVRDLDPRATALPPERPSQLRDAVMRSWRRMSPAAKELTRIVAVGGHPQTGERLARIAPDLGFDHPVLPALREAVDARVLLAVPDGRYWFTHPLLAEVLDGDLLAEQRQRMNARYASVLGSTPGSGPGDDADPAELADHYERAGMVEPAFRWAVRAAEATGGAPERLRLLRRALSLWPALDNPGIDRLELWDRARVAAREAGLGPDELEAVEALIALLPADREPLRLGRLMFRRLRLIAWMGLAQPDLEAMRTAVAVTASHSESAEHAMTTAMLADALLDVGDPAAVSLTAEALEMAERTGDPEAVAEALVGTAYAKMGLREPDAAQDAERSWEIASRARLFTTMRVAVYAMANARLDLSNRERAAIFRRGAEGLVAAGAPHSDVAEMCAWEARGLLLAGDWVDCRRRLRVALGARPGPRGDVVARVAAAGLACLQGRPAEAEGHLARAEEVFGEGVGGLQDVFLDETRALVALGAGDPSAAFDIALAGLEQEPYVEELLPLGARALADQAEAARDPAPVLERLAAFRRRYPTVISDPRASVREDEGALQALADAETARATGDPAELTLWRAAAEACHESGNPWDEAYARWRLARTTLRDRRTHREAPEALRGAYRLAQRLAARPLLTDLEQLARTARVDLTETAHPIEPPPSLPGLTRREREVLGYLLAGATNSEIAKELVLSEKTVGVHISNMLRKTGTTNRVQLADLARRTA